MGDLYRNVVLKTMNNYIYSFEKLDVWKKSKTLNTFIYQKTKNFPVSEISGITHQMRRSSVSISSNIAEGCGRKLGKEQRRFYQYALSSAYELLNQLILSQEIGFIEQSDYLEARKLIQIITLQLNSLSKYTLNSSQ